MNNEYTNFSDRLNGKKPSSTVEQKFQTRGALIMELAELLRPALMQRLQGCRDENGMIVQPARVRGIALIIAQEMVKAKQAA